MRDISCKLLVIGAGPGGYVCAIRAGQLGIDTVVVEAKKLGGTCLNIGCVPSKALIHAADEFARAVQFTSSESPFGISVAAPQIDLARTMQWKDGIVGRLNGGVSTLLKKARVKIVEGWATFLDGKTVEIQTEIGNQVIRAEHVVIATGSKPVELPALPFGGPIISSAEALSLKGVPRRLVVVGAGYIGLELGTAFAKLGAAVTVIEALPRILPQYDAELTRPVAERLQALGITVLTGARAKAPTPSKDGLVVEQSDGSSTIIDADSILVAVGRKAATDGWGLEEIDLDMDGPFMAIYDDCRLWIVC
ncbi:MAG: dihydrolipoyl dehydrogenase family protein, partial [Rhodopila sp.]